MEKLVGRLASHHAAAERKATAAEEEEGADVRAAKAATMGEDGDLLMRGDRVHETERHVFACVCTLLAKGAAVPMTYDPGCCVLLQDYLILLRVDISFLFVRMLLGR